ncbi:MAG: alanyl-tRNA editing protein [Candidatus Hodarchaeales archaeon]|jgi:misacylated tRNA(Ala) deacylase
MINRLYLKDCYLDTFNAKIIDKNATYVILDQTAFYPESGGQLGDTGYLMSGKNSFMVTNTRQKQGKILHELKSTEGLELGMSIKGKIEWDRRHKLMRVHTAQHIISRFFQINFKAETVSSSLKTATSRLDLHPLRKISSDELISLSAEINKKVAEKMLVTISFLPREEAIEFLKEKKYQTKYLGMVPSSVKEFRIVSINNYDWAACAGTHVKNTAEIGEINLLKTKNKGKQRERIIYSLVP